MASTLGNAFCAATGTGFQSPVPGLPFEVVEGKRAGTGRLADDDPAHHARLLVGEAVVVVHPFDGEGDVEVVAGIHEEP
jgi:hypothetical protein